MQDRWDILGRWAAQFIAIVGLNVCGWGLLFNLHIIETEPDAGPGAHLTVLLLPPLMIVFWRLLDLRLWAAVATLALLAWRCTDAYVLLGQKGGRSWSSFLWQFAPTFAGALACAVAVAALLCAVLLSSGAWREGF